MGWGIRDRGKTCTTRQRRDGIEGVSAIEIEPGRAVPNHWDESHLIERWEDRKARRAAERLERHS